MKRRTSIHCLLSVLLLTVYLGQPCPHSATANKPAPLAVVENPQLAGTSESAASSQPSLANLPEGLRLAFSSASGKDNPAYHAHPIPSGFRFDNPSQALSADFSAGGVSNHEESADWQLHLAVPHPHAGSGGSLYLTSLTSVLGTPLVTWDKYIDGALWYPEMIISAIPSDTIQVVDVLHLLTEGHLASAPFVRVNVCGDAPEGQAAPSLRSPSHQAAVVPLALASPNAVLWNQPLSTVNQNAYLSQNFSDYPTYSSFLADDFVNSSPWAISTIFIPGDGWSGFTTLFNATALTWQIYADCYGVPCGDPSGNGNPPVWTLTLLPTNPQVIISSATPGWLPSNATLNLASPLTLPAGHWWLVFYPTISYSSGGQYGRQPSDTTNDYTGQFINPGGAYGWGTTWRDWTVLSPTQQDIAFRLEGAPAAGFAQIESWDPALLTLLDWAATGGNVTILPGQLFWTGDLVTPTTISLTKWYHVKAGPPTPTVLWEELWVEGVLLETRLVVIHRELAYLPLVLR